MASKVREAPPTLPMRTPGTMVDPHLCHRGPLGSTAGPEGRSKRSSLRFQSWEARAPVQAGTSLYPPPPPFVDCVPFHVPDHVADHVDPLHVLHVFDDVSNHVPLFLDSDVVLEGVTLCCRHVLALKGTEHPTAANKNNTHCLCCAPLRHSHLFTRCSHSHLHLQTHATPDRALATFIGPILANAHDPKWSSC
jgi:hypothetical protein